MTGDTVHFVVNLSISKGKFDAFESIARTMTAGSQKEPGTLGYDWYFSADRQHCRLLETYADADSVLSHLTGPVVQDLVPELLGTASLSSFEVYGDPGPKAMQMLAGFGAQIFKPWHRLSR